MQQNIESKDVLINLKNQLESHAFAVYITNDADEAKEIFLHDILPVCSPKTISYGDSETFRSTGLYDCLKENHAEQFIEIFDGKRRTTEEWIEFARPNHSVDLYITGSNAITEDGTLVNLDMFGNRVAAIMFGPKDVVIFIGRNKIVPDLESAMTRIREYTAPANAVRLKTNTPCSKTGTCMKCNCPDKICRYWSIVESSFPAGKIKVILINEDLGI